MNRPARSRKSRPEIRRILANLKGEDWRSPVPGSHLGTYQLESLIGDGAFGEVWIARNTSSDTRAALKVFRPGRFPESLENSAIRFHDGAAAMVRLRNSPGVVKIFEGATSSNGYLWFAMEYHPERDLSRFMKKRKLATNDAFRIIEDLLGAIREAHQREGGQILHRDIRPENILISKTPDGPRAVLADFDIAYYEDLFRERQETGMMLSNARYVPLDVVQSDDPIEAMRRPSNDLFAAAVCILEILTNVGCRISSNAKELNALLSKQGVGATISGTRRRRIAGFLSKALSQDAAIRYSRIEDLNAAWKLTKKHSFGREALLITPALGICATGAMAFDWGWFHLRHHVEVRVLYSLVAGIVTLLPPATLAAWLFTALSVRANAWRQTTHQLARERPRLVLWGAIGSLLAPVALFYVTNAGSRFNTAVLSSTRPCILIDEDGFAAQSWLASPSSVFKVGGHKQLQCAGGTDNPSELVGQSCATQVPRLLRVNNPEFHIREAQPRGPNSIHSNVGGFLNAARLAGTDSDATPLNANEAGFHHAQAADLVERMRNNAVVRCGPACDQIEVVVDGTNIGLELVSRGLLKKSEAGLDDFDAYAAAETHARRNHLGLWGKLDAIEKERKRAEELAGCPEKCCQGTPCSEHDSCEARTGCMLCRDGEKGRWELRLERVDRALGWKEEKVCISTATCEQACVDVKNIGSRFARVGCALKSTDFPSVFMEVMGTDKHGNEHRIAEKHQRFAKPDAATPCQKMIFQSLRERKAIIPKVVFNVAYLPPPKE